VNTTAGRRPGLLTFAAIMMFLLGGFVAQPVIIVLFAHATGIAANVEATVGDPLWVWCILDGVFALMAIYAGIDILRGGQTGRILGFIVAAFSALICFVFIQAAPWAVLAVIALDLLAIYALATQGDYFHGERTSAR
jgi:hypothetical protein